MNPAFALAVLAVMFGALFIAFFIQNMNLREELTNTKARARAEEQLKWNAEQDLKWKTESRDSWRKIAEKAIDDYHATLTLLHGTEESLKLHETALKDANDAIQKLEAERPTVGAVEFGWGDGSEELKRLRRLFERMRHFNSNYVHKPGEVSHGDGGVTIGLPCCPCVEFIQKEYVDAALGTDA